MRRLRALLVRVAGLVQRKDDAEFVAELQSHLEMHVEENLRAGMSAEEARRQALIRLGGVEQTRQVYREQGTLPWLENLLRDVRYALRGFKRYPVFAIAAIATLALGIGATTAVFSVVDRILFRSLPYAQDDRLVSVGLVQSLEKQEFTLGGFFYEWRHNQKVFSSMTFERGTHACNLTEANPVHLQCALVEQAFLPTLGVVPELGRNFLAEEDVPRGAKVALISDGLWLSRFNRDPNALSKTITLDDHPVRIIGVLPRDFEMPRLQRADIVLPAAVDIAAQHTVNSGIGYPMWAFARLKHGLNLAEARAEMDPLFRHTQLWIPAQFRGDFHLQIRSVRDRQMQDVYIGAWILFGAVLAVLLIACANVASLFSARSAARQKELAMRSALGASRGRLIRQTLTEALIISIAGAAAGGVLAEALLRIFIAVAPTGVPFLASTRLDLRIALFTVILSVVCASLCGIMPAIEKPRVTSLLVRSLHSVAQVRLRRALVVAQIAVSIVLLSGGSLMLKSFWNLQHEKLGMQTHNVVTAQVSLNAARYRTGQAYMDFYLRAETALRGLPGVNSVGMSDSLPPDANAWHGGMRFADIFANGKARAAAGTGGTVIRRLVTPDYFRVLQIPIVEGRGFSEQDRTASGDFIILNKLLAERLFPQGGAIGQHIQFANYMPYFVLDGPVYTVTGVAADVKNAGLMGQEEPELYQLRSNHHPESWNSTCVILIETSLPVGVVTPWVRSQIAEIDPTVPVEIGTLTETVDRLADRPRFETALLGFFALCGLLMAVIGLYGVIAYVASQRTQEIGVRMALGATRCGILRLIASEGLRLIVLGGAIGIVAALAATQLLKSLLFQVGAHDPMSFVAVTLLLALVALVATLIPARAAMKTDPMTALRVE